MRKPCKTRRSILLHLTKRIKRLKEKHSNTAKLIRSRQADGLRVAGLIEWQGRIAACLVEVWRLKRQIEGKAPR